MLTLKEGLRDGHFQEIVLSDMLLSPKDLWAQLFKDD